MPPQPFWKGVTALRRPLPVFDPDMALLPRPCDPLFDLTIAVVTPLFGGGSVPCVTDDTHPVRGASVRGHLRFWWRACKAGAYASPDDLFAAEEKIWGSITLPGALTVSIETLAAGRARPCVEDRGRFQDHYPAYALFPFQGDKKSGTTPADAREGVRFRLRLGLAAGVDTATKDSLAAAAKAALWAWITFGGIGARTRRGCGTLYCADPLFAPPDRPGDLTSWLRQAAREHVTSSAPRLPVPALHGSRLLLGREQKAPLLAWESAVNVMYDYRQKTGAGRDIGQSSNRPGRSRWPEPDSIRRLAGTSSRGHEPAHPADAYYPRADLGLPIIFHFKDQRGGDPSDATLQARGEQATRMASPIILKALPLSERQAVPLVLCLNALHIWDKGVPDVELRYGNRPYLLDKEAHLRGSGKSALVEPLREQGRNAAGAREGFMRFAAGTGAFFG